MIKGSCNCGAISFEVTGPVRSVIVRSDDNTHFEAFVVSSDFEGKRPIQRHQMIYAALGSRMGNEIHALSIQALTPDEASGR